MPILNKLLAKITEIKHPITLSDEQLVNIYKIVSAINLTKDIDIITAMNTLTIKTNTH